MPYYKDLLEFINHQAQASKSISSETKKSTRTEHYQSKGFLSVKPVTSFASNVTGNICTLCNKERHPLYACTRFKLLPRDKMMSIIKASELCINCLCSGHFSKQCPSLNQCKKCQKLHYTLIHSDNKEHPPSQSDRIPISPKPTTEGTVSSHTAAGVAFNTLLMTCQVLARSPDGSSVKARALLDSASSTSFISERLAQGLCLPRSRHSIRISGITGISHHSPLQSVATLNACAVHASTNDLLISAVIVPRITYDLPVQPVHCNSQWTHLNDLELADPNFGCPGRIDLLLGVDVYADVVLHGWRSGPPGSPVAFETMFGWVLAGRTATKVSTSLSVATHHVSVISGDDLLRKFWEIEESPRDPSNLSPDERSVVQHFKDTHIHSNEGRFVVALPKKSPSKVLGESRSQAVTQFLSLERSLHSKNQFQEFSNVMEECFEMKHAEPVPAVDLQKPPNEVFYLPMHAV